MTENNNNTLDLKAYRRALSIVFTIHIIMFVISFTAAIIAQSSAVLADSMDFIGDAASYALSMYVLSKTQLMRSIFSIFKAVTMMSFGIPVLIYAMVRISDGSPPDYQIMNLAGIAGIISHLICVYYLLPFKNGDSNQTSVWICTINDLLSNALTVVASIAVMYTNSIVPDIIAAMCIVGLAIYGAIIILRQALREIREHRAQKIYAQQSS